jgi:PTS system mannose-specific IIC component
VLVASTALPEADMSLITLAILYALPLGHLGAWLEQLYRKRQNLSYNAVISWNREQPTRSNTPQALTHRALAELFLFYLSLFLLCALPLISLLKITRPWLGSNFAPTWPLLWTAACAGAILALRIRKARMVGVLALLMGILAGGF